MAIQYRGTDDRNEEGQENHEDNKKENQKIWGKLRTFIGLGLWLSHKVNIINR